MATTRLGLSATSSKTSSFSAKSKVYGNFTTLGADATPRIPQEFLAKESSSGLLSGYYYLLKYLSKRG